MVTKIIPAALFMIIAFTSAYAIEFDGDEATVWQMEETYWGYVASGDVDAYVSLWHDDFVGWPCFSWTPTGKANIGSWVEEIRDNNWTLTYKLRPEAVQLFGGVAVVHYAAEYDFDYGNGTRKGEGEWRKFTHTWMKVDEEWQIIGGMCAAQEPVRTLSK